MRALAAVLALVMLSAGCSKRCEPDALLAREQVVADLARQSLDPAYLGPAPALHRDLPALQFDYVKADRRLDYVVTCSRARGIELSVWDYAARDAG